ncbi:flagellum-specific ATP synthase FliI [Betaproteobacteria bacterium GR16-43]|nr:flagellum-specific ATP synthase FliI [Betaproteobacteria bacterium GR16-43]
MDAGQRLANHLSTARDRVALSSPLHPTGRLTRVAGLVMEATGLRLPVGAGCMVTDGRDVEVEAEVVGFHGSRLYLMPVHEVHGLRPGATLTPVENWPALKYRGGAAAPRRQEDRSKRLPAGDALLGRVVDSAGKPLDDRGPIDADRQVGLASRAVNPITRTPIDKPLDVGVRAINALMTVGRGQRLGLFAGSGVGKSVLIGMMARYTAADVIVVGLIGERGREVQEFVAQILGAEGLKRAIVVAAPADTTPLMRVQAASYATALAEEFRARGKNVLLVMDSLTRYAMALREIALAIGEPPATKGYPPSVFARLPQLVERAGNAQGPGSITAFYTVLTEGDDHNDPIADNARAILDGHIVLARDLAESGHYPAIDVEASVSRLMHQVSQPADLEAARRFRSLFSRERRNRDLVAIGAYVRGQDPLLDEALERRGDMEKFLRQDMLEHASLDASRSGLRHFSGGKK